MKKTLILLSFLAVFMCIALSEAAPIRGEGPFNITGTIIEATWVPEKFRKGVPGMSGSLGRDVTIPAHFILKLVDYHGIPAENAARITGYIKYNAYGAKRPAGMPPFVLVKINSNNRNLLKKGMKIHISGYTIRGDEGGVWTYNTGLKILK